MKIGRTLGVVLGITAALGFGFMAAGIGMPQAEAAPVTGVCPNTTFLSNSGACDIEFVLSSTGTLTTLVNSTTPYEGSDDQLVGVINNDPSVNITGLALTGPSGLFGFDGDGICTYGVGNAFGNTPATPSSLLSYCSASQLAGTDGTNGNDYQGPDNSNVNGFSGFTSSGTTGQANFTTPLLNGQTTFFSLELAPSSAITGSINPPPPTPEPGTLALFGTVGLGMLPILRNKFRK